MNTETEGSAMQSLLRFFAALRGWRAWLVYGGVLLAISLPGLWPASRGPVQTAQATIVWKGRVPGDVVFQRRDGSIVNSSWPRDALKLQIDGRSEPALYATSLANQLNSFAVGERVQVQYVVQTKLISEKVFVHRVTKHAQGEP